VVEAVESKDICAYDMKMNDEMDGAWSIGVAFWLVAASSLLIP
jgi:hypothetical protein